MRREGGEKGRTELGGGEGGRTSAAGFKGRMEGGR